MPDRTYLRPLALARAVVLLVLVAAGAVGAFGSGHGLQSLRAIPSDPGALDPVCRGSTVDPILIHNLFSGLARQARQANDGDRWTTGPDGAETVNLSKTDEIAFELTPGIMWRGGCGELTCVAGEIDYFRRAAASYDALMAIPPMHANIRQVRAIDPLWVGPNMTNDVSHMKTNIRTETHFAVRRVPDAGAIVPARTTTPEFSCRAIIYASLHRTILTP